MASGNIFKLMINDGKQDALLNATAKLQERIDDIFTIRMENCMKKMDTYFSDEQNYYKDSKFLQNKDLYLSDPMGYCADKSQAVHATMIEISKTHKVFIGACYKPFVSTAFSYLKINEKEGSQQFGNEISFIVPQIGAWIQDMVLHIQLNGLKADNALDKVKYCALLGHRLIEEVTFLVNNTPIASYTGELYNKHFQFNVPDNKKQGWLRNIGHEIPNLAYMTPDPANVEYREYRWFGDGPQTFKTVQKTVDMYIPLLFWFNLDVAQAFPNIKIPKGGVKIKIKFAPLSKLIAVADGGGGGAYTAPTIGISDLYVNHISTLPEIETIMLSDYDFTLIRCHKIFEKIVINNQDNILLKNLKYCVEQIAISFRPVSNLEDVDNWHRNVVLTAVDIKMPVVAKLTDGTYSVAINNATYYTEDDVIDTLGLKIKDIDVFQTDTTAKYSSFNPYAAVGLNTPTDKGWLLMNLQLRPDLYDPSGHIDISRNRDIYLNYTSSYITNENRAKLTVIAQCINFIMIIKNSAHLKFL